MATKDVKDNTSSADSSSKLFTRAEVAKHTDPKDTWIIIHNNVYNVTPFLNEVAIFFLQIINYSLLYQLITLTFES